ncbi:MAG: hypothetical protein FWC60_04745 [Firmicutes bacterium]|nr:hypothetical protein [Bacillota bacterium]
MLSYLENPREIEAKVSQTYALLKELCQVDDFPAISYNARRALGVIWQVANHLEIQFEQIYDD